ncbi:PspC domain-containing protein [Nonomuraea sp. NPDC003804]|uniref:PspC domain-containing protein n=1 Tax=Nonomuraea sp. NPDC003804 TaxID=3154547 RepID=UPI0033B6E483
MTEAPPIDQAAPPRVLKRSDEGRMLTGVCAGLGRYTGIDPVVFRVGFPMLVLGSGIGLFLYVAAFLLMKESNGRPGYVEQWTRRDFDAETVFALLTGIAGFGLIVNLATVWLGTGTLVVATLMAITLLTAHARGMDLPALARSLPERLNRRTEPLAPEDIGHGPAPTGLRGEPTPVRREAPPTTSFATAAFRTPPAPGTQAPVTPPAADAPRPQEVRHAEPVRPAHEDQHTQIQGAQEIRETQDVQKAREDRDSGEGADLRGPAPEEGHRPGAGRPAAPEPQPTVEIHQPPAWQASREAEGERPAPTRVNEIPGAEPYGPPPPRRQAPPPRQPAYSYGEPFAPHGPFQPLDPRRRAGYSPYDLSRYGPQVATPRPRRRRSFTGVITVLLALIVGGIVVAAQATSGSTAPSLTAVGGAMLITIGAGLLVATWLGRGAGLIALGTVLTLIISVSLMLGNLPGKIGTSTWTPTTMAEVRRTYEVGIGDGTLDLSELKLSPGAKVTFNAKLAVGELVVIVPPTARVEVHATSRVGDVKVGPSFEGGTDVEVDRVLEPETPPKGEPPTIVLNLKGGLGDMEVRVAA